MDTLEELQQYLEDLKAARRAILRGGQSYTSKGGRRLDRIPIEDLNKMINRAAMDIVLVNNGGVTVSPVEFPEPY